MRTRLRIVIGTQAAARTDVMSGQGRNSVPMDVTTIASAINLAGAVAGSTGAAGERRHGNPE